MLSHRKDVRTVSLAVPPRDARETMRDILDLDVEGRGVQKIETAPRQHALPGARSARCRHSGFSLGVADTVAPAIDEMIVDHADRLHKGIDDRGATEFETARFQILRDFPRQFGFRGNFADVTEIVADRLAVDEVPQILAKALLFLDVEVSARRRERPFDLGAVAHDACMLHQPFYFLRLVARAARR